MITEDYCSPEVSKMLKEKGLGKEHFRHYVQVCNDDGTIEAVTKDASKQPKAAKTISSRR